ncbi:MAG: hypothetical protein V5A46_05340 [Haloferacaceae archaeon]
MEASRSSGLGDAIRIDLVRLYETWMEIAFPRQLDPGTVLGKWRPETTLQKVAYYGWGTIGVPLVAVGYPLLLVGVAVRYNARKLDSAGTRLGIAGVVFLAALVWGGLSAAARIQLSPTAFLAVAAASAVAVVSAGLAVLFSRIGGRPASVAFAYPFGLTALFLPPVVAALFVQPLGAAILDPSEALAIWLLNSVLSVGGLGDWLRASFSLRARYLFVEGEGFALMWFAIAVPTGWVLGLLAALADVVRPKQE